MAESWTDLGTVAPPAPATNNDGTRKAGADDWSDLGSAVSEGSSPLAKAMPLPSEAETPESSTGGALARGAVRGVLPGAAGMAGAGAGAEAGAAIGSVAGPIGTLGGGFLGGLVGAYLAATGTGKLQEEGLKALPDAARAWLGQSDEQRQADIEAHPDAAEIGELAPQLAIMGPGAKGATILKRLASRAMGAGLFGAQEAAQETAQGQQLDPASIAIAAGAGAVMGKPTALGRALAGVGAAPVHAVVDRFADRSTPRPPAGDVGNIMAAGNVDDAIKSASDAATSGPVYDLEDEARKAEAAAAGAAPVEETAPEGAEVAPSTAETTTETPDTTAPLTEDSVRQMMAEHFDNFAKQLRGEDTEAAPEEAAGGTPEEAAEAPTESAQEGQPAPEDDWQATDVAPQDETAITPPENAPETTPQAPVSGEPAPPAKYTGKDLNTYLGKIQKARDAWVEAVKADPTPEGTKAAQAEFERASDQAFSELPRSTARPQPPIVQFRQQFAEIEKTLPPVPEGQTRLWRGNRPGEVGQNPSFTSDAPGIALPFQKAYGGSLSYVDVPNEWVAAQPQRPGATAAEFTVPQDIAAKAKIVPERTIDNAATADASPPTSAAEVAAPQAAPSTLQAAPAVEEPRQQAAEAIQGQPLFSRTGPSEPADTEVRGRASPELAVKRAAVAAGVRERLNMLGLKDVGARVYDYMAEVANPSDTDSIHGLYSPEGKFIALSLRAKDGLSGSLNHESIHAFRDLGLFKPDEWAMLAKHAQDNDWRGKFNIDQRYTGWSEDAKTEESIAEAFRDWAAKRGTQEPTVAQGRVATLFNKMWMALQAVGRFLKARGYDTPESLFGAIERGEIGARKRAPEIGARGAKFSRGENEDPRDIADESVRALIDSVVKPGSGTAARQIAAGGLEQFKNVNALESGDIVGSLSPRTLATLDDPSARAWNAWQARDQQGHINSESLRRIISDTVIPLTPESRRRVYGAIELARTLNWRPRDDGTPIQVRNTSYWQARITKVGDKYVLNAAETRAFHDLLNLGTKGWDMFIGALAQREKWTGALDPAAIRQAASEQEDGFAARRLNRLADAVEGASTIRNRPYFPALRFGDYFISVRPKAPPGAPRPDVAWFETVEKPALADVLGKNRTQASELPAVQEAVARLRAMKQTDGSLAFPAATHDIEVGDLRSRSDVLRSLNIPAIEKLFMLMERGVVGADMAKAMGEEGAKAAYANAAEAAKNAMLDAIYDDLKAGFKKEAKFVPGYSADFDRAIGTHIGQVGRNAADIVHHDAVESAFQDIQDNHPNRQVKSYWSHWRQYMDNPATPFGRVTSTMARYGAAWVMAANPSTTLFVASHTPMMAAPVLGVGGNMGRATLELGRALREVYSAIAFDKVHGASINTTKLGRDARERAFVAMMDEAGVTHSVGADDLRAINGRQAALWGKAAPAVNRAMDIAMSNISVVDQANRNAISLAAYRMAQDQPVLEKMLAPWLKHNAILRERVVREGLTPESFAKFMLEEGAGAWGKSNQAVAMRGAEGNLLFALHGFQTRYLSTLWKLSMNMGPEGRVAAAWMMGALAMSVGVLGLPLVQDGVSALETVWKAVTGKDPMIEAHVRELFAGTSWGKAGAALMLRGPLSLASGIDFGSRIGFGDIISRSASASDLMGTVPSIFAGALARAYMRAQTGQGMAAAGAEMLPSVLRNPARAAIEKSQGYESTSGSPLRRPEDVTLPDTVKQVLGMPPLANEQAYARDQYYQRLSQRDQEVRQRTVKTAANMIMRAQRASAGGDAQQAEDITKTLSSLLGDYNSAHWQAPIKGPELKDAIFEATNPDLYRASKTPKTVRGEAFSSPYP